MLKKYLRFLVSLFMVFSNVAFGSQDTAGDSFILKTEDNNRKSGSVYFTSNKKNEVLFKVSIWGSVQFPGVHYLPLGTRFLEAVSLAGGPLDSANLEKIKLSSRFESGLQIKEISISNAMADSQFNPVLKADDIVLISEDKSIQRTTLLLQIGTFILSAAAFGLLLDQHSKVK